MSNDKQHVHRLAYIPKDLDMNDGRHKTVKAVCADCEAEFIYVRVPTEATDSPVNDTALPEEPRQLKASYPSSAPKQDETLDELIKEHGIIALLETPTKDGKQPKLKAAIQAHIQKEVAKARIDEVSSLLRTYKMTRDVMYDELRKKGYETSISIRAVELMIKNLQDRLAALQNSQKDSK